MKAIELEILRHREQEKREEVRKRFLDAVAEISRRRGREISWALWGRRCCFLCGFFWGNWCKAWGKKAGENVKKWKAVVEEVTQSFDDMVLSKSTKWPRITRLSRRGKNSR